MGGRRRRPAAARAAARPAAAARAAAAERRPRRHGRQRRRRPARAEPAASCPRRLHDRQASRRRTSWASPDPMSGARQHLRRPDDRAPTAATRTRPTSRPSARRTSSVLKAAFICDIVRCGTLPVGARHEPRRLQGPVPESRRPRSTSTTRRATGSAPPTRPRRRSLTALDASAQFLFAVQLWFFKQHGRRTSRTWKTSIDGFGNSLLDYTVVPYVTEVRATGHERSRMPAMIIGGKSARLRAQHATWRAASRAISSGARSGRRWVTRRPRRRSPRRAHPLGASGSGRHSASASVGA